jgi:hypothetical protein
LLYQQDDYPKGLIDWQVFLLIDSIFVIQLGTIKIQPSILINNSPVVRLLSRSRTC